MVEDNNHLSSFKFRYEENGQHTWTNFAVLLDALKPAPSSSSSHIVGVGVDGALLNRLRHKEEVVP